MEKKERRVSRDPQGALRCMFRLNRKQAAFVARSALRNTRPESPALTAKQLLLERCSEILGEPYPGRSKPGPKEEGK
jgi:hypothetical protein